MSGFTGWAKALVVVGAALAASACSTYPEAPRYSTRPMAVGGMPQGADPRYPVEPPPAAYEAPPPARAPIAEIEGGALPPPVSQPRYEPPRAEPFRAPPPLVNAPRAAEPAAGAPAPAPSLGGMGGAVAYVIQPGDTISGVGRRFQTPVQTLIDLNNLGPRGTISNGQRITLPGTAVDTGSDPYATGPAPVGVVVTQAGTPPPPPPPPPVGNPAAPPPPREAAATSSVGLQWPVRGDILRRFGPVGLGERNNGINIGAAAGSAVNAAAAGRVAYVGDDIVGQGLTVLIVHRDGWRTAYGHLGSATVDDGDDVRAGQQIGTVGLTAGDGRPSIHFETRRMQGDEPVAVDPLTVLPR